MNTRSFYMDICQNLREYHNLTEYRVSSFALMQTRTTSRSFFQWTMCDGRMGYIEPWCITQKTGRAVTRRYLGKNYLLDKKLQSFVLLVHETTRTVIYGCYSWYGKRTLVKQGFKKRLSFHIVTSCAALSTANTHFACYLKHHNSLSQCNYKSDDHSIICEAISRHIGVFVNRRNGK